MVFVLTSHLDSEFTKRFFGAVFLRYGLAATATLRIPLMADAWAKALVSVEVPLRCTQTAGVGHHLPG